METTKEIDNLNEKIEKTREEYFNLINDRNKIFSKDLENKYFEVTSFGASTIIYFHCKFIIINEKINCKGEKFLLYDDKLYMYEVNGEIQYDYNPSIDSYEFREITKTEYNEIKSKYIK